jgi:uncharacterized protein (TIGR00251 family)
VLVLTTTEHGVRFEVQLAPRSSRDAILGVHDGALKIALTAPPVDGAANASLVAFLAKQLGVPKRDVRITHGLTSRRKTIEVDGARPDVIAALAAPTNVGASASVRARK